MNLALQGERAKSVLEMERAALKNLLAGAHAALLLFAILPFDLFGITQLDVAHQPVRYHQTRRQRAQFSAR